MNQGARGDGQGARLSKEEILASGRACGLIRRWLEIARDEDFFVGRAGAAAGIGGVASGGVGRGEWGAGFDVTTRALEGCGVLGAPDRTVRARLRPRSEGVIAGGALVRDVIEVFGAGRTGWRQEIADGSRAGPGAAVGVLEGPVREVLAVERTALNVVGRLSGVATLTAKFVERVAGTRAAVMDTRKTTPGMRVAEKYAVACGGGSNHRMSLADAVLVKDNHLAGIGDDRLADVVRGIAKRARGSAGGKAGVGPAFVEVEVDRPAQLGVILSAGGCGVDVVLLDNFDDAQLVEAVRMRDASGVAVALEASGGVTLDRVGAVARTGVDRISVGSLTHGAAWLDIGLDIDDA